MTTPTTPRERYSVTRHDIGRGVRRNCMHCPVALAIQRVHPDYLVAVSQAWIQVGAKRYVTPPAVAEFIRHFDTSACYWPREQPFPKNLAQPFEFELSEEQP